MFILQRAYSLILNPLFLITGKIDEKIRNVIISVCCVFLAGFFIAYFSTAFKEVLYKQHGQNNLICGIALAILIIFSVKAPLRRVMWDPIAFYLMFAAGAGTVLISFLHSIGSGYRSFGFMMMFFFPCLYYVWNNRGDYDVLFKRLTASTSIVGILFYLRVIILALTGELETESFRVKAFLYNANMFSMIGMVMVCSALYMFFVNKQIRAWFVLALFSFAIGCEIVRMGGSRTSIMVCFAGVFSAAVFWGKITDKFKTVTDKRKMLLRLGMIVAVTVAMFFLGEILLDINSMIIYRNNNEISAEQGDVDDSVDSKNADVDEDAKDAIENNGAPAAGRFRKEEGMDIIKYTSGRTIIWRNYARCLNVLGNDFDQTDFKTLTGGGVSHAHNNFFEFGYRCGVPVALLHIFLELYAGIVCICFLFNKKYKDPYYIFAIVFMVCYAAESMLDIATIPFERHAPFFFYMLLIVVLGRTHTGRRERRYRRQERELRKKGGRFIGYSAKH